jgi:hypothetical protein
MAACKGRLPARQESGRDTNPHIWRKSMHIKVLRFGAGPAQRLLLGGVG